MGQTHIPKGKKQDTKGNPAISSGVPFIQIQICNLHELLQVTSKPIRNFLEAANSVMWLAGAGQIMILPLEHAQA